MSSIKVTGNKIKVNMGLAFLTHIFLLANSIIDTEQTLYTKAENKHYVHFYLTNKKAEVPRGTSSGHSKM